MAADRQFEIQSVPPRQVPPRQGSGLSAAAVGSRLPDFVTFPETAKKTPSHAVAIRRPAKARAGSYYKCELARLYKCSPRTLCNWISRWPEEFAEAGYRKTDKQLTPRQVRLLFELIGEPEF